MEGTERKIMVAFDQWSYMTITSWIFDGCRVSGVKEYKLTVLLCEANCKK
jgi:hypothetical protein